MRWPWLPPDTLETRADPGDPSAAIRMVNYRGLLRTEIGGKDCALFVIDADGNRWVRIEWDGTVTNGRMSDES